MKTYVLIIVTAVFCARGTTQQGKLAWRVKDMVLARSQTVNFYGPSERIVLTLTTRTLHQMMLAHLRITQAADVQADLFIIVEGEDPNAFAGLIYGRRMVGINVRMIKLIGDSGDEYAALFGHESAHWAKGHVAAGQTRANTLKTLGALAGMGLGLAGVPAGELISSIGFDLIEASYSHDQERQPDVQSIDYMLTTNYDPRGAIRLHEKMLKMPGALRLPFFQVIRAALSGSKISNRRLPRSQHHPTLIKVVGWDSPHILKHVRVG